MSPSSPRGAWLSLTPEPERELPAAVAALRVQGAPADGAVATERARVERLVVRGRRRSWLAYLARVVEMIEGSAASSDRGVQQARAVAGEVVRNHHLLQLGLPGRDAEDTESDRLRLAALSGEPRTSNGGRR